MKRLSISFALALVLGMALASPAFALTGAEYGAKVTKCAQEMGFSGTMNPGVCHKGFSGAKECMH